MVNYGTGMYLFTEMEESMFQIGDYIICGMNGVCRVEAITKMDIAGVNQDRLYYQLSPVYESGSTVFTPIDNKKMVIRRVLTREEAWDFIDSIPNIETLWIENEKMRKERYKEALYSGSNREWVQIIKTVYMRKKERSIQRKRVTETDEKYVKAAKEQLYGELAIVLHEDISEIENLITKRITAALAGSRL